MRAVGWIFYGLAISVAVVGMLLGLAVATGADLVPAATIGLQSPALRPFWDAVVTGMRIVGLVIALASVVLAAAMAANGVLVGRWFTLNQRMSRIERALQGGRELSRSDERTSDPAMPAFNHDRT